MPVARLPDTSSSDEGVDVPSRRQLAGVLAGLAAVSVVLAADAGASGAGRFAAAQTTEQPTIAIVQVDERVGPAGVVRSVEGDRRFEVLREYERLPLVSVVATDGRSFDELVRDLLVLDGVRDVTEDVAAEPELDTSLQVIGAPQAFQLGEQGAGTTIAIFDTGADQGHPFIGDRIVEEACFSTRWGFARRSLCPSGSSTQTGAGSASSESAACFEGQRHLCSHGPHVAGIAAGDGQSMSSGPSSGVAPAADLVIYQIFHRVDDPVTCDPNWPPDPDDPDAPTEPDPDLTPCTRSIRTDGLAAIDHLLGLIEDGRPVAAANFSLGSGRYAEPCPDSVYEVGFAALRAAGTLPVASAGNRGLGEEVSSPGCEPSVLTVGNSTSSDGVYFGSDRGPLLDLFAPGEDIISSIGGSAFGDMVGTSMAAPHVAGAIAVVAGSQPSATPQVIQQLLEETGVPITYPTGPGTAADNSASWVADQTTPRLDLLAALQQASGFGQLSFGTDTTQIAVDEGQVAEVAGWIEGGQPPIELWTDHGSIAQAGTTWVWQVPAVDGPRSSREVRVRATDAVGSSSELVIDLEVLNVAPQVSLASGGWDRPFRGQPTNVEASFFDPGRDDLGGRFWVDCDADRPGDAVPVRSQSGGGRYSLGGLLPPRVGTLTAVCGTDVTEAEPPFVVEIAVTDRDGGTGTARRTVRWFDIREDQIARLDTSGLQVGWIDQRAAVVELQRELLLDLDVFGPPEVDLDLTWRWGDGTTDRTSHPVGRDDDLAPRELTGEMRGIGVQAAHTWREPGVHTVEVEVVGGRESLPPSVITVAVTGAEREPWGAVTWARALTRADATMRAYTEVVGLLSPRFGVRGSFDPAQAIEVLGDYRPAEADAATAMEAELLTAWLNVGSGAVDLDATVAFRGDRVSLLDALLQAEWLLEAPGTAVTVQRRVASDLAAINGDEASGLDGARGAAGFAGGADLVPGMRWSLAGLVSWSWQQATALGVGVDRDRVEAAARDRPGKRWVGKP